MYGTPHTQRKEARSAQIKSARRKLSALGANQARSEQKRARLKISILTIEKKNHFWKNDFHCFKKDQCEK